jgi:hypothetical protein
VAKPNPRKLLANYQVLKDLLNLDTIILVDGGVDVVLRGDEKRIGTPVEDMMARLFASTKTCL